MRLLLSAQPPGDAECARWSDAAPNTVTRDTSATNDRYVSAVLNARHEDPDALFDRLRTEIFSYRIFPSPLMRFTVCSTLAREGSLIVQRIGIGPVRIEAAVRVVEVWDTSQDDTRDAGFRYVTLAGHPECGVATFRIHKAATGAVSLIFEAESRPGSALTRLTRPIARSIQVSATIAALRRLSGQHDVARTSRAVGQ